MVKILFRSRLRPEGLDEYGPLAERMEALAERQPGFRSIKTFVAQDGERLSVVEFESEAAVAAWRDHPEHREAMRRGREALYASYTVEVLSPVRSARFDRGE